MKKHTVKGVSAAIASLALVGTCFAAPALADTASTSVFESETPATETAAAEGADAAQAGDEVDFASAIMDTLGIDDATLDQILSGDLSMVEDALGPDIDADTQAAIDEAEKNLSEAGITSEVLKQTINLFAGQAHAYLVDTISEIEAFLEDNGYIIDSPVLFGGESPLASDAAAQQVDYHGASLLVPGDYTMEEMTGEDLADALADEGVGGITDGFTSALFAAAPSGETGVIVAEYAPEGVSAADIFAQADADKFFNYDDGENMVTAGHATLDDGTPIVELGYVNYATDEDAQPCAYELIVMPSDHDGFVVVFALSDKAAPTEELGSLADVLTSLTGTGAL